jgi:hypothetical protein
MDRRLSFDGFEQLIQGPLVGTDQHSFERIVRLLQQQHASHAAPIALLQRKLVGKRLSPESARNAWEGTILLKQAMESKLGRVIGIQTAAVEYFDLIEREPGDAPSGGRKRTRKPKIVGTRHIDPHAPDYHLARLKDELQRSKRYNHALSAIVLDTGALPLQMRGGSGEEPEDGLAAVVRIIERTIRSVDILAPCGVNRLLIILPDTNLREAQELADRIRSNVGERTARMPLFTGSVYVAIAAGQCETEVSAAAFVNTLENGLGPGPLQQDNDGDGATT